jgi:hypothetical protein
MTNKAGPFGGQTLNPQLEIVAANAAQGPDERRDAEFLELHAEHEAARQHEADVLAKAKAVHQGTPPADSAEWKAYLRSIKDREAAKARVVEFRAKHGWPAQ